MEASVVTNRVEVEIMGEPYVLRGEAPPDEIRALARKVNLLVQDITARNPRMSMLKAAVLAAINIAEELQKLQDSYDGLVKMIEEDREK